MQVLRAMSESHLAVNVLTCTTAPLVACVGCAGAIIHSNPIMRRGVAAGMMERAVQVAAIDMLNKAINIIISHT
jgi:hypothetical protein